MNLDQELLRIANEIELEEGKKKKKPYDSVTYTTGDLQKNIDHFNKCLSGKANNDNSKGPLPDWALAKGADGSSSIPSSAATSGESSGGDAGASAGGAVGESLEETADPSRGLINLNTKKNVRPGEYLLLASNGMPCKVSKIEYPNIYIMGAGGKLLPMTDKAFKDVKWDAENVELVQVDPYKDTGETKDAEKKVVLTNDLEKENKKMELNEVKRYVRRYYIRPQDIFCSNKAEILKALIDHQNEDLTIYTLNNLGDIKDIRKLTDADIIYTYTDGILYDKNGVRVMDYDLYIKHEEQRDEINPDQVSDSTFKDVYDDRMTDQTVVEDLNEFKQDFDSVNAFGESLHEEKENVCCICGEPIEGYGNNAEPYKKGRCCDACNLHYVIPMRLDQVMAQQKKDSK